MFDYLRGRRSCLVDELQSLYNRQAQEGWEEESLKAEVLTW
jgi:hypothetical protein